MGTNKKGQVNDLVKMVITVVLIITVVGFIFFSSGPLYAAIRGLNFDSLPADVKQNVVNNWNSFVDNINSCMNLTDRECLCNGFPNFPGTFPKDFKINIKDNNISLFYVPQSAVIKSAIVGNFKEADIFDDKINLGISALDYIDFKGEEVAGKSYPLSTNIPVMTDKFYKTAIDTVTYVVFAASQAEKLFLEQQTNINNRPQCLDWRMSAIIKFNDFISCANSNQIDRICPFSVKNDGVFRINIGGTYLAATTLFYNQQTVMNYNSTQKKSVSVNSPVLVPCDSSFFVLKDGESVKIISESGKVCLKKR